MSGATVTPLNSLRASMRRANLHDHIVDALGVRIVRGDFPSGEVLPNEATLAFASDDTPMRRRDSSS